MAGPLRIFINFPTPYATPDRRGKSVTTSTVIFTSRGLNRVNLRDRDGQSKIKKKRENNENPFEQSPFPLDKTFPFSNSTKSPPTHPYCHANAASAGKTFNGTAWHYFRWPENFTWSRNELGWPLERMCRIPACKIYTYRYVNTYVCMHGWGEGEVEMGARE